METTFSFAKFYSMTYWEQLKLTKILLLFERLKKNKLGTAFVIVGGRNNELSEGYGYVASKTRKTSRKLYLKKSFRKNEKFSC